MFLNAFWQCSTAIGIDKNSVARYSHQRLQNFSMKSSNSSQLAPLIQKIYNLPLPSVLNEFQICISVSQYVVCGPKYFTSPPPALVLSNGPKSARTWSPLTSPAPRTTTAWGSTSRLTTRKWRRSWTSPSPNRVRELARPRNVSSIGRMIRRMTLGDLTSPHLSMPNNLENAV